MVMSSGILNSILSFISDHPALFCIGFLLYVFIFALSILFSGPKPGPNPFGKDTSRKPKPLETDQKKRDGILKQGFHVKRIPEQLDAIVVGSGVGGLAVANILSRLGKKVLVLEQHDQAGGCCHTFIDKGFEFDVGIHYIGEMRNNTISKLLINQLTDGQIQWADLNDVQDQVALGQPGKAKFYKQVSGRDAWRRSMIEQFPEEEKAIDRYLELIGDVRRNLLGVVALKLKSKWLCKLLIMTGLLHRITKYFTYSQRTLEEVLEEITDNKDLRAVLGYSFGDYGNLPNNASFAMHAALNNHYLYGSSYPVGGASEFAYHMIPPIEAAGGKVLVRAPVSEIIIKEGRAVGVRVSRTSGDVLIHAPMIISDAGVVNTFKTLLPTEIAEKSSISSLISQKRIRSGQGAMSLFVGLKGSKEELGLKAQNIWAFTSNELSKVSEEYLAMSAEDAMHSDVPLLFISFPSAKDPTIKDRFPGKSTCTVITLAQWEWFEQWKDGRVNKRGAEYENVKNAIAQRMWDQVLSIYPHLKDKVEYFDIGSPLSNNYYIATPKGEIYGLDHDLQRFGSPEVVMTLRPETGIPGLYLTGQDIFSCGFMGAIMGGLICSSRVLNRNLWEDLVNLKKTIQKKK